MLLEHGEQLPLHVLLPHVQHARVDEPLFQGQRGLPGLGGGHGGGRERPGDEEAREDVVVLPSPEPDADLEGFFFKMMMKTLDLHGVDFRGGGRESAGEGSAGRLGGGGEGVEVAERKKKCRLEKSPFRPRFFFYSP